MTMNDNDILNRGDLERMSQCGGDGFASLVSRAFDNLEASALAYNEADFVQEMRARFGMQGPNLDFSAAGTYRYYRPAKAGLPRSIMGDDALGDIQSALARLCELPHVALTGGGLLAALVELLLHMVERTSATLPRKRVLLAASLHPATRQALMTRLGFHGVDAQMIGFDLKSGAIDEKRLAEIEPGEYAALVIAWPNFFGRFDVIDALSQWAAPAHTPIVGLVNPQALAWLKSPALLFPDAFHVLLGECHTLGLSALRQSTCPAFVASGEAQIVESMNPSNCTPVAPDDIACVHAAIDASGQLQLRQGGLRGRRNLVELVERLCELDRVSLAFEGAFANEAVIRVDGIDLEKGQAMLNGHNIVAGHALGMHYPELVDCLLLHCNDRHQPGDIDRFVNRFAAMLRTLSTAPCPVKPKFT